jgi:hypothetical protein
MNLLYGLKFCYRSFLYPSTLGSLALPRLNVFFRAPQGQARGPSLVVGGLWTYTLLPWLKLKYGRWGPSRAALGDAWTFIRYYVCYTFDEWQVYPAEVDTEKFRDQKITNHQLSVTSTPRIA